jgi:hypothetical protein
MIIAEVRNGCFFNMMDHEIQNEEYGIQKSIVGILRVLVESTYVFT